MRPPLAALLALASLAPTASSQLHRLVFDQRVDLACDTTRIAIFDDARDSAELRLALTGRDVARDDIEAWPVRGWWLVPTRDSARSVAGVTELVRELAADGVVQFAAPVLLGADGAMLIPGRDLFIGSTDPDDHAFVATVLAREGEIERDFSGFRGITRVRTSAKNGFDVLARANALAIEPGVAFADVDFVYTGVMDHVPTDPLYPSCWGLDNTGQVFGGVPGVDMDMPEAWDLTSGSPAVKIAILDVGVQTDHPDLSVLPGADVTSDGPSDGRPQNACDNHGTSVAGCAASVGNTLGAIGTAPGCSIVSIRAMIAVPQCNFTWTTTTAWVLSALNSVQALGCRITNCSNGWQNQPVITTAYQQLHAAGVVHFASTGNSSATTIHYPASLAVVNGVGALNSDGALAWFSNTGASIDMVAPGVDVWTTDRTTYQGTSPGDYAQASGTSLATPYAAGIAALVLSRNPSLNADQVDAVLRGTCTDLGPAGYDTTFGWGLVKARAALDLAGTGCPSPSNTCATSPNSVGAGAIVSATGSTSVIANDLALSISGCPSITSGKMAFGPNATQVPFGNGVRCIGAPVRLMPIITSNASGVATQVVDWAHLPAGAVVHSAETWYFQFLYRNPLGGGAGFNASDALSVTLCP